LLFKEGNEGRVFDLVGAEGLQQACCIGVGCKRTQVGHNLFLGKGVADIAFFFYRDTFDGSLFDQGFELGVVHRVYIRLPRYHVSVQGKKQQEDNEEIPKGEGEFLLVFSPGFIDVDPRFYVEFLFKSVFPIFLTLIVFAHVYGSL